MWATFHFSDFTHLLGTWMVRWLETLGQNPPPTRDHGLCAWQYLRHRPPKGPPSGATGVACALVDEPCFSIIVGGV